MSRLVQMAAEELFSDNLGPNYIPPKTLADLDRNIAATREHLRAIDRRIQHGIDLAYWQDCRWKTRQQLAIYLRAKRKLLQDQKIKATIIANAKAYGAWLEDICDGIRKSGGPK